MYFQGVSNYWTRKLSDKNSTKIAINIKVDSFHRKMDYNSQTGDPSKITINEPDDLSILWNDQTQTHSRLMDTNLDDIEMNDELLDKLVTAILQDNTLDLHVNNEASNNPTQSSLSCNQEMQEPNSTTGVSDNTLQAWQKLLEGDNTIVEQPQTQSRTNPSINMRSASQTPRPLIRRISEDMFHRSLTRARSQLIAASTPHKALPRMHLKASPLESSSSTNSNNRQSSPADSSATCSSPKSSSTGPMTRSRCTSEAWQSHSRSWQTITPGSGSRYNLRPRSSTGSRSNANSCSSQFRNASNVRKTTPKDNYPTPEHKYQTRSRTSSDKTKAITRCCTKLKVVICRARMSMIARLRNGRSSIRLPTSQKRLSTPKKRLQPRRLCLRKAKISAHRKSSRHALSKRKR